MHSHCGDIPIFRQSNALFFEAVLGSDFCLMVTVDFPLCVCYANHSNAVVSLVDLGIPEDVAVLAHVGGIQGNVWPDNVCGGGYELQREAENFVANIATD